MSSICVRRLMTFGCEMKKTYYIENLVTTPRTSSATTTTTTLVAIGVYRLGNGARVSGSQNMIRNSRSMGYDADDDDDDDDDDDERSDLAYSSKTAAGYFTFCGTLAKSACAQIRHCFVFLVLKICAALISQARKM